MPDPIPTPTVELQPTPAVPVESDRVRAKRFRQIVNLVNHVRTAPGGERLFTRFNQLEIIEHWLLMVNFFVLAVTGLLEMFAHNRISAGIITVVFDDIDKVRGIHNLAALFFTALAVEHAVRVVVKWFVKNEPPVLMPQRTDFRDFLSIWKYNLGRNIPRPEFARFNIDQKFTYWTVAIFSAVMLLTSMIMWFQIEVARWMPEAVLPMRTLHELTGFLAVVTMLPWHLYHTVLKEWNPSIFTGSLDEKTIRRKHLLEYRQILAALDEYQTHTNVSPAGDDQPGVELIHTQEEYALNQDIVGQQSEAEDTPIDVEKDDGSQS